jgi:hypothetical protein
MMTGDEYRQHIEMLGMSQNGAARFLGIAERTSRRFAAGDQAIPITIEPLLRAQGQEPSRTSSHARA